MYCLYKKNIISTLHTKTGLFGEIDWAMRQGLRASIRVEDSVQLVLEPEWTSQRVDHAEWFPPE